MDIKPGCIIMWSGAIVDIPEGWLLCDGTNGTPDLTDKFIRAVNIDNEVGVAVGNNVVALTEENIPAHKHADAITNTTGNHRHLYYVTDASSTNMTDPSLSSYGMDALYNTSTSSVTHTHGVISVESVGSQSLDITPPYYKLAFLMYQEV